MNTRILIFDGSFSGFLSAVFTAYEQKIEVIDIQSHQKGQSKLFAESQVVSTDKTKAKRVWNAIQNKNHSAMRMIYFAFLSEHKGIEMVLFSYIRRLFSKTDANSDVSERISAKVLHLSEMVAREKYRMEQSLRLEEMEDGGLFRTITPDFNILPLISKHFRSRYPDQPWTIYDVKRAYGLFFNGSEIEMIQGDKEALPKGAVVKGDRFSGNEYGSRELWQNYFKNKTKTALKNRVFSYSGRSSKSLPIAV